MRFSKFFATIIVVFALTALLFNQSISKYAEQKYHTTFTLDSPLLIALNTPANALASMIENLLPDPAKLGFNTGESTLDSTPQEEKRIKLEEGKLVIKNSATLLLIGDSMMQGVSMTLTPQLKRRNLQVIDMAKQSTGLTYTKFFNWNEALENALEENPNIDIIVVMLGANDPWNIGRVRFGTPEWDSIYTERIQAIIEAAKAHDAFVFWYQVPLVKNKKLSAKIEHLNTLYQAQDDQERVFFLETNPIFAPDGEYLPERENAKGNKVRIRANDGIHFSGYGSRLLSSLLLERLEVIIEESEESPEAQNTQDTAKDSLTKPASPAAADTQATPTPPNHSSTPSRPNTQSSPSAPNAPAQSLEPAIDSTPLPTAPNNPNPPANLADTTAPKPATQSTPTLPTNPTTATKTPNPAKPSPSSPKTPSNTPPNPTQKPTLDAPAKESTKESTKEAAKQSTQNTAKDSPTKPATQPTAQPKAQPTPTPVPTPTTTPKQNPPTPLNTPTEIPIEIPIDLPADIPPSSQGGTLEDKTDPSTPANDETIPFAKVQESDTKGAL